MAKPSSVWEPNAEYIIPGSEIELGQEIARGGYGTVYKGKCRGQVVAIKKLHNQALSGDKLEELKKEVQIMSQLRHPGILLLMGVCTEPDNVALVMEFVEGKSLYTVLHEEKVQLSTTQKFQLAKEIAKGCYWLHCLSPPIIHRDIKPANILVDTHFRVQLCDFGLSCVKEVSNERKAKVVGSPYWMAPEVLTGHPNTEKSDVYAYAVLLWEIFTGDAPNKDVTDYRAYMYDVVNQGRRPPLPEGLFPAMKDLISVAWAQDPKKRPNFATILELLDEVFIQMVIPEQPARDMWKEFKAESHYPFFVDWDLFIAKFYGKLKILALQGDVGVRCLRDFIAARSTDMTSSNAVKLIVNAQQFGDFLDRFGPVWTNPEKPVNIVNEFKLLCANEWFHGEVDTDEVRLRLGDKPPGSFLVRLSSAARSFTISKVNEESQIIHQRVFRKGDAYVIVDNNKPVAFNSLKELVDGVKELLNITKPVGDKRIFAVHFQANDAAGKNEEYVNCEFNSSAFPAIVPAATPSPKPEERAKERKKKEKKAAKKDKKAGKKGKEGKKKKKV